MKKILAAILTLSFTFVLLINTQTVFAYNSGVEAFVTSLYSDCLGRSPDPAGFDDWCQKLTNGTVTGKQAAYGFFFSPEFQTKANSMTDDEFIDAYYKVFLNRAADPSGKSYWANQIADTTNDISILFTGFADSTEFANKCSSYGITAGPHINVPTTVRGASGGGSGGGGAANTSLQSAAESAFAALQAAATSHGWSITDSYVVRATSTQYGIFYHLEIPSDSRGKRASVSAMIKVEQQGNVVRLYNCQVPLGADISNTSYDNYSSYVLMDNPSLYYEEMFSRIA